MATDELPPTGKSQPVVTIHSPDGRVFLWLDEESPVLSWQVGDVVEWRNRHWIVSDRTKEGDSLSVTLAAAA